MDFPVTTKVERSRYASPDLFAGQDWDESFAIEASSPRRANETMPLAESDLEDVSDRGTAEFRPQRYRGVSLRGALLADDRTSGGRPDSTDLSLPLGRAARFVEEVVDRVRRGRISPLQLATVSFCAGVGATLLGVLIAL